MFEKAIFAKLPETYLWITIVYFSFILPKNSFVYINMCPGNQPWKMEVKISQSKWPLYVKDSHRKIQMSTIGWPNLAMVALYMSKACYYAQYAATTSIIYSCFGYLISFYTCQYDHRCKMLRQIFVNLAHQLS